MQKIKVYSLKLLFRILAILALLFLIFWLMRGCSDSQNVLPDAPRHIVPIDSSDVISDKDSVYQLVKGRLNILVKDKTVDIQDFATDFKNAYSSANYEIIYYDDKTRRIQVKVPEQERDSLKTDIKQRLSQYDLLIWDETLFQSSGIPADPGFSNQDKSWHLEVVKAYEAWDKSFGDNNIIIAIVDNGFDVNHAEFLNRTYKPYNTVTRDDDVFTNQKAKHGTHVGGLAAGNKDNSEGASGVAPSCQLMPIMVSDANGLMTSSAIIDGVLYAIYNGADVVNLSLGMAINPNAKNTPDHIQLEIIQTFLLDQEEFWNEIFEIADEANVTIVMAGGNDNIMIGLDPMQRVASTIKVNAVDRNLQKASFSNYGPYSTISAPGVQIYSSVPNDNYEYLDGTSMASPIVAGGVALIKSHRPDITNKELITLLKNTAKPIRQSNKKVGDLMQLDKALDIAKTNQPILDTTNDVCTDVSQQIADLEKEIERLKNQCPDQIVDQDTMKMPDTISNQDFLKGKWKSTTSILNEEKEEIILYFTFDGSSDVLFELVEPDANQCDATCDLSLGLSQFEMDQKNPAMCNSGGKYTQYYPYHYTCAADANGLVECTAQNKKIKLNRHTFNLIKIK